MKSIDKELFAAAAAEVAAGNVDQSLYIKALAVSGGVESTARATYISLRAEELHAEQEHLDRAISRQRTRASIASGKATAHRLALTAASLLFPGAGQVAFGRNKAAALFFSVWVAGILFSFPVAAAAALWAAADAFHRFPAAMARVYPSQELLRGPRA